MRGTIALVAFGTLLAIASGWCLFGCFIDPVHDQQIAALGPEAPGVSPGPLHRPGQPCLVCHGGTGPASHQFSVAGTVYRVQGMPTVQPDAIVDLSDSNDAGVAVQTNAAGNFYVTPTLYDPHWPMRGIQVSFGNNIAAMISHIGRNGSCADCHVEPESASSPGSVYLYFDLSSIPDGG
jgi:hypothetical protein